MSPQNNNPRREMEEVPLHRLATQAWWLGQPYEEESAGFTDVARDSSDSGESITAETISDISSVHETTSASEKATSSASDDTDDLDKWEFVHRASGSATAAAQLTGPVFTASTDDSDDAALDVAHEDIAPVLACNARDDVPDISRVMKYLHLPKTIAEILVHQPAVLDAFYMYKANFMITAPGAEPVHSKDVLPQYIRIKRW